MICLTASARSGSSYFDAGRIKELRPFAVNEDRWLSPSKHHAADAGIKDELVHVRGGKDALQHGSRLV